MVYKTDKTPTKTPTKGIGVPPVLKEDFHFVVPPEAPVFTPSAQDFQDPLSYIAKIRPLAEKCGICKIKPPPDWQPPFAVDVDRFKFTPRIQRLNELEANTRVKLNFLDQIAKFWELQGSSLKIPMVERRALDLYALHRYVEDEGGFYGTTTNRKWSKVASRMGFPNGRDLGSVLKHHYERILHPFDIFKQGKIVSDIKSENETESDTDGNVSDSKKREKDYKPHGIVSRQAIKPPLEKYARRSKRCFSKQGKQSKGKVRNGGWSDEETAEATEEPAPVEVKSRSRKKESVKKPLPMEYDPLAKYICHNCERGDAEENMLLCDGCDDSYHTFCLLPPLTEIPKGDWRCPRCVAAEVSKPTEAFGFEQAQREYTLQQFGDMADQFKADYFNKPVNMVSSSEVESEFWRIVSSIDEDVTVEYGADLHTMDHGSGFPTKATTEEMATCEMEYARSSWNLNNLPCLENSVLGHINADISGMKVPWMYVGMCFATFCWHNEDHWSYSINYLHWGEPKTWYGVPGHQAEAFEGAMKKAAPELFDSQPDLLHQLVTIMNPNTLMGSGVSVFRTDQQAGEFVITFPRAYHAGFNQGYNFAEAVNFAPADWLQKGRECVEHYSMLRRYCVFSHDELVCKMASSCKDLHVAVATATYQDMLQMVQTEKKLRKSLLEWGVTEAEREVFEVLPDDERQCEVCKTTCFLSAVTCSCSQDQLVCLRHCTELCKCPPEKHLLRYRYTLDELPVMLEQLKLTAECYEQWLEEVQEALKERKLTLNELKALAGTGQDNKFPDTDLFRALMEAVSEAEKCATVAQQLANKKLRTRTRQTAESKYKLTVEELTLFYEEIESLKCVLKEADIIRDLLDRVKEFQKDAQKLLDLESAESVALDKCIDAGVMLDVDLPELVVLRQNLQRVTWLEEVADTKEDEDQVTLEALRGLLDAGVELPPHPLVETEMADLQQLLMSVEKWEEKAKECLSCKARQPVSAFEKLLKEAEQMPAYLPSEPALKDSLKKAKDWISKVQTIESAPDYPYLNTLETLVNKGRYIPVKLELLTIFETKLENAKGWKERTARTFLRKNSRYTLMEALSPRTEFGMSVLKMKKKKPSEELNHSAPLVYDVKLEGSVSPVDVVAAFKHAERQEMVSMRDLRLQNLRKRASDQGDIKYCICRRGATGFMLQCELCKDWFHATCVPLPKNAGAKTKSSAQQLAAAATREVKFLCPCCLRSRRPRLETILSLLVSLQKLEVRLPEGEALQCLTERAMNWQDRARTSLATEEIANALAKLSVLSQKLVEAAAREKTEKIISSELKKAAGKIGNPELSRRVSRMSGVSSSEDSPTAATSSTPGAGGAGSSWLSSHDTQEDRSEQDNSQHSFQDRAEEPPPSMTYFTGTSEHAYSTASKTSVIKHSKQPPLVLSEIARAELEELMLEGDLLEVSLDETLHIWRILQATKPKPEKEKYPGIEQLETELMTSKVDKDRVKARQRARKRRMEEYEAQQQSLKGKKLKVQTYNPAPSLYEVPKPAVLPPTVPPPPLKKGVKKSLKQLRDVSKKVKGVKQLKRKPLEPEKKPLVKRKKKIERETSSESDSDENCAAKKCLKPTGKEVDWVQCDGGCEKWYHFRCVGINKKDIDDDEDYICDGCQRMSAMRAPYTAQRHPPPMGVAAGTRHRHPPAHPHHPPHPTHQDHGDSMVTNRVKVEPTNLDESLGLDALLSLAGGGLPESEQPGGMPLENNPNWLHQQGFPPYDIELHRSFQHMQGMSSRSGLNISSPMSNPPELLLTPVPNSQNHAYPIPDAPIQNYSPMEAHKLGPEPQYPSYGLPDPLIQYAGHDAQNYSPQPVYPQNYPNSNPPPNYPPSYPNTVQNYPPERPYVQPGPSYAPQNYHYTSHPSPGYGKAAEAPYPEQFPPMPVQESYVLTQLTDSKSNYPVQSYPISESSFNQPDFQRMFPEAKPAEEDTLAPVPEPVPEQIKEELQALPPAPPVPPPAPELPQPEPEVEGAAMGQLEEPPPAENTVQSVDGDVPTPSEPQ